MAELWNDFTGKLGGLAGKWTAYAAFGSFLLYLLGYMTLRFQLSAYGVATTVDTFDESYLFAGCRFLVYLIYTLPSLFITLLALAAIGYVPYLLYKLLPVSVKDRLKSWASDWCAKPIRLPLLGVVFGVAMVQFVLRKSFVLGNLLLRKQLPEDWISSVLLASDGILNLYFAGLIAGTLLTGAILLYVLHRGTATTSASKLFLAILIFMFAVEFLMLPVNYGVMISTQTLPRVAEMSGDDKATEGHRAWLVSNSKDAVTYLSLDSNDQRMLVTIPRKDARFRIVAYDDIFCVLFGGNHAESRPCPR